MADTTKIEWTDATWNPITGCTLVSEGCRHCYAARLAATRLRHLPSRAGLARINAAGEAKFTGEVRLNEGWLDQPLHWRKPRRIFVCAHGDLFHEDVPDDWIDRVFAVMARCSRHRFQVLTKRASRMRAYMQKLSDCARRAEQDGEWFHRGFSAPLSGDIAFPLPNVWLGVSVEDQVTADARIPHLLATPAARRFISAEPLLGPVELRGIVAGDIGINALTGIRSDGSGPSGFSRGPALNLVIVGGESGPRARPMDPEWARSLRDQCRSDGVAFFMKQMAPPRKAPVPEDLQIREFPE